jgi:hypothetical protein
VRQLSDLGLLFDIPVLHYCPLCSAYCREDLLTDSCFACPWPGGKSKQCECGEYNYYFEYIFFKSNFNSELCYYYINTIKNLMDYIRRIGHGLGFDPVNFEEL